MIKTRITAFIIFLLGLGVGYFVYVSEPSMGKGLPFHNTFSSRVPFKLGLDLSGGTHLIYKADVSEVKNGDVKNAMDSLRDVIERRVNLFGVSEPVIQTQSGNFVNGGEERLIVDLPGVTDIKKAVELIGQTPLLEFRIANPDANKPQNLTVDKNGVATIEPNQPFIKTDLTGRYLDHATLEFNPNTREPIVSLVFDSTGTELFKKITEQNVGKTVAIYLDGAPISTPTVREAITTGKAQISGNFTPEEAKTLVGRLNSGALPVPISLVSTETIGATLGASAMHAGVKAGIFGLLAVALFLVFWYRLPGLLAVLALSIYVALMLTLFKLIPVTLTAAGIAGFIISIGIAVDANVLIFERVKEEMRSGKSVADAVHGGFKKAWNSIRDSNTSTIITAIILFWFGTALIQGFALTLGLGVLVSMLSAIIISRLFLYAIGVKTDTKIVRFLFGSGLTK